VSTLETIANQEYKYGFQTQIESETIPKGLTEETIRLISAKKKEPAFLLEFRLNAFRQWQKMKEPHWVEANYPPIDYQDIIYYAAPKPKKRLKA
jgi:Fe-S cluster assembly protein SufB